MLCKSRMFVLPFQNMSGDPEQEFFADGISEDITTALSKIRVVVSSSRATAHLAPRPARLRHQAGFRQDEGQGALHLCRTDALFPPKIAPDVIKALTAAGVEARYFELDSDLGHSSSGPEHAKWSPVLSEFLAPLVARLN